MGGRCRLLGLLCALGEEGSILGPAKDPPLQPSPHWATCCAPDAFLTPKGDLTSLPGMGKVRWGTEHVGSGDFGASGGVARD